MADFPRPYPPMLLSEIKHAIHKPGWVNEEKYDGYRAMAYKEGARVQLISRNLKDLTRQFEGVAEAVAWLRAPTLILDGEIAVFDENLVSHLAYLRGAPAEKILTPPVFVAFDCLYARGKGLAEGAATAPSRDPGKGARWSGRSGPRRPPAGR